MRIRSRTGTVAALGTTQTLAWASSYYLPALLAAPIARDLGTTPSTVFAALSVALIVSAFLGPVAGRMIDQHGGRYVLVATNVVFACGLTGLAFSQSVAGLFAAWLVIGIGMGFGLYEAAFASTVRLYGSDSRAAITGITLIAGFASTVGWPLTAWLETTFGWREACMVWAAFHIIFCAPLNAMLPRAEALAAKPPPKIIGNERFSRATPTPGKLMVILLATVFAIAWFTSTAMAAHMPTLLQAAGATLAAAVAAAALVGPAQVAARVAEFGLVRRVHPLTTARAAALAHPVGAAILLLAGAPAAVIFTILHGAGNGILTIAIGTLPLVMFGPHGYGARQALLMVPARIAQAAAPFAFGVCLERWGLASLWLSSSLGIIAFAALLWLARVNRRADADAP